MLGVGLTSQMREVHVESSPVVLAKASVPSEVSAITSEAISLAEAPKPKPAPPLGDNESIIWDFLIAQGFSRNQAAGIAGNLQQEHGFKTSDARPHGLGIAQWIGNRASNLEAKGNYLDLTVQLNFLMEELNGVEGAAGQAIRSSGSVEEAVRAFQNKFERCGVCMEGQRIQYAYGILQRY